jgi:hypothetical protein
MDAAASLLSSILLVISQNNDNQLHFCEMVLVYNSGDDRVCLP